MVGPTGIRYAGMEHDDTAATAHGRGKAGDAGLAVDPDRVFMQALGGAKKVWALQAAALAEMSPWAYFQFNAIYRYN